MWGYSYGGKGSNKWEGPIFSCIDMRIIEDEMVPKVLFLRGIGGNSLWANDNLFLHFSRRTQLLPESPVNF